VYLSSADPANPQYVSARDVLPENGLFDEWISYPNLSSGIAGIVSLVGLALQIRRQRFDAVFYMMTRYRTAAQIRRDKLFFSLAGIRKIIGDDFVRKHNLPLEIPKPVPRIEKEGTFLLRLLEENGIVDSSSAFTPDLSLTEEERAAAREWMESTGIMNYGGPRIAVGPGSKWDSKIWEEDRYADVVARLIETDDIVPVIFGGPEDREKGERLLAIWGRGANAAGTLNVRNAAAALAECAFYLGNDTGTMHLAAAVGTKCVAMFSAVDWADRFEPIGTQHVLFRRSVECEGCHSPTCLNAEFPNKCLKLITADEVFQACASVLSAGKTIS
jgi:ADP-heptose:LPS heptosyltransferase